MGDWIQKELDSSEKKRKDKLEKEGLKEFFNFPVGETLIEIDTKVEPRATKFDKMAFRAKIDGELYDVPVTDVVYNKVLKQLKKGNKKITIIRTGTDKTTTRYDVKL
jgi:hypothetical protein